jgi:hypothetical protein
MCDRNGGGGERGEAVKKIGKSEDFVYGIFLIIKISSIFNFDFLSHRLFSIKDIVNYNDN